MYFWFLYLYFIFNTEWTKDELAGQVFVFLLAGFETSATLLVFCVHELVLNPNVQDKLYQEVKEFQEENGVLTHENMSKLKYLECVLNGSYHFLFIIFYYILSSACIFHA